MSPRRLLTRWSDLGRGARAHRHRSAIELPTVAVRVPNEGGNHTPHMTTGGWSRVWNRNAEVNLSRGVKIKNTRDPILRDRDPGNPISRWTGKSQDGGSFRQLLLQTSVKKTGNDTTRNHSAEEEEELHPVYPPIRSNARTQSLRKAPPPVLQCVWFFFYVYDRQQNFLLLPLLGFSSSVLGPDIVFFFHNTDLEKNDFSFCAD